MVTAQFNLKYYLSLCQKAIRTEDIIVTFPRWTNRWSFSSTGQNGNYNQLFCECLHVNNV